MTRCTWISRRRIKICSPFFHMCIWDPPFAPCHPPPPIFSVRWMTMGLGTFVMFFREWFSGGLLLQ